MTVEVPASLDGQRLDRSVALLGSLSRAGAARLVDQGSVRLDGAVVTQRRRLLRAGQQLVVDLPAPEADLPVPDPGIALHVVYEDEHLVVVDKPAGMVVHRGAGQRHGTLVEGLLARYPELADLPAAGAGDPDRPGIVHRLDKDTSGLLVVARSVAAYRTLAGQFRRHDAQRSYRALVHGVPEAASGLIDAPIGRSTRTPTRMAVSASGRPARTTYRVEQAFRRPVPTALLGVELQTGRTHQVRVHLAAIGHPVVGDDRYGRPGQAAQDRRTLGATRQFLHAWRLTVIHPDGRPRTWESPLPEDLVRVLDRLEADQA